jgi:hypothetical protein
MGDRLSPRPLDYYEEPPVVRPRTVTTIVQSLAGGLLAFFGLSLLYACARMVGSIIMHERPAHSIFWIAVFVSVGAIFLVVGMMALVCVFREARGIPSWKNCQLKSGTHEGNARKA